MILAWASPFNKPVPYNEYWYDPIDLYLHKLALLESSFDIQRNSSYPIVSTDISRYQDAYG